MKRTTQQKNCQREIITPCGLLEQTIIAQAQADAKRKLERIIEREGDAGGERRKPYYLEMLVEEAKRAIYWSMYTMALMDLRNEKAPVPTKATEAMSIH